MVVSNHRPSSNVVKLKPTLLFSAGYLSNAVYMLKFSFMTDVIDNVAMSRPSVNFAAIERLKKDRKCKCHI